MTKKIILILNPDEKEMLKIFSQQPLTNKWWGISKKHQKIWMKLKENDVVYIGYKNSSKFLYEATIKEKQIDENLSIKIWGNNIKYKIKKYLINFYKIKKIDRGFHEFLRINDIENDSKPGWYYIQNENKNKIKNNKQNKTKQIKLPVDFDEPPKKFKSTITRFIRDTKKTIKLKKLYNYTCQICDLKIEIKKGKYYSEVHHIHPLKKGGDDSFSNMIVLCPNHHTLFDYGVLKIHKNGKESMKNGKKYRKISFVGNHKIHEKNIQYQNEEM